MNDDTISRRAAIDGLMCLVKQNECDLMPDLLHWTGVKAMLESLPSAQPDHNADISKKVTDSC